MFDPLASGGVGTVDQVSDATAADLPDQALRSALEFAVGIAAAGARQRPALPFPTELKRMLRAHKLGPKELAEVRAAVEGDDEFRKHLAALATVELVDEVGMLWLVRSEGWAQHIAELVPGSHAGDEVSIRSEQRRRAAAEDAAARARADLLALKVEVERDRESKAGLRVEVDRLRNELDELRHRLRESQRQEHATTQALAKAESDLSEARRLLASQAEPPPVIPVDATAVRERIAGAIAASSDAARLLGSALDELAALEIESPDTAQDARPRRPRRTPIKLPGGVLEGSVEAADFLVRTAGARVLVDGYNVAKLGWPALDLQPQRDQCIRAAENLAKRRKIDITIVFDGAAVEGAHAPSRRRVRIAYSLPGVSADDVLRAEVASASRMQPIVVVTNDRAIVTDVVALGANHVSSDAFLTLAR